MSVFFLLCRRLLSLFLSFSIGLQENDSGGFASLSRILVFRADQKRKSKRHDSRAALKGGKKEAHDEQNVARKKKERRRI